MNRVELLTKYIGGIQRPGSKYRDVSRDHFWWFARSQESHKKFGFDASIGINNLLIGEI